MGGAERQGLLLARCLRDVHGANIEVWGLNHMGSVSIWCDKYNIPWRLISWNWNGGAKPLAKGLLRLFWELRRAKPDVLLPFTMPLNVACGLFWGMTGAKTCIWNQRDMGIHRFNRWIERYAVRNTPFFVSNSSHGGNFLTAELGVLSERVEVIPNGIALPPPQNDRATWRKRLGIPASSPVACMVANLHVFKDHPTLLQAWRLVLTGSHEFPPILLIAGHDYGTGVNLKALAELLGISAQLRFLGQIEDISGVLNASDVGVFSSFREGLPNGVLECMLAGLPVVATDIEGHRAALGRDSHKFLVPPGNASAMAQAISRLFHDQSLSRITGKSNSERVRTEFSVEQMCERYYQLMVRALVQ